MQPATPTLDKFIMKKIVLISAVVLLAATMSRQNCYAKTGSRRLTVKKNYLTTCYSSSADSLQLPQDVMDVITTVVNATNDFNMEAVANLYTPNAIIADDEPPYSWNGPTAGIQWVNAVEQACKENKISKLRASIGDVIVYQKNGDNIYVVVPVSYSGNQPGKRHFSTRGVFNFVLREVNGKWIVKSQTWISKKGIV